MEIEQLIGRHLRLQRELTSAYSTLPWQTEWIDRLLHDIAATEREIAALQPVEDQPRRNVDQGEGMHDDIPLDG